MRDLSAILEQSFLGVVVEEWLWVGTLWLVASLALLAVRRFLVWRMQSRAERTGRAGYVFGAELLRRTKALFLVLVGLYAAGFIVALPETVERVLSTLAFVALLVQVVIWGNALLSLYVEHVREKKLEDDASTVMTVQVLGFVGRLVLYTVVFLLALDNFGVEVTALVASLGIGGIAVALALQNILGDLLASLSIVLDKPFVVGDFLSVDDYLGTVEYVGLKTTRLRSLAGEQIVFSNNDLLQSRIRNFKRMYERRIVFSIQTTYETPYETVRRIPEIIQEIVEEQEPVRFDRSHFARFADHALEFETVYYVTVPEYNTYMDVQEAINLAILRRFEEEGIEFAYPTHTVQVHPVTVDVRQMEANASPSGGE